MTQLKNSQGKQIVPELPDIQALGDTRNIQLQGAGVRKLKLPMLVDCDLRNIHTIANIEALVNVDKNQKGVHMSRFVEIFSSFEHPMSLAALAVLTSEARRKLESQSAYCCLTFSLPFSILSPVTKKFSYSVSEFSLRCFSTQSSCETEVGCRVSVTTLCPCSREISDYGAHNQRGAVKVGFSSEKAEYEDLVNCIEDAGSSRLYPILKRVDEKYVTEAAYKKPVFVEDLARSVILNIEDRFNPNWLASDIENLESIHNHSAAAVAYRGTPPYWAVFHRPDFA